MKPVDPFGLWPDVASTVRGLRDGSAPRHRDYAFHTIYAPVEPGPSSFIARFTGLRGTTGRLILRVQGARSIRPERDDPRVYVDLPGNDGDDVSVSVDFIAEAGRVYALHARRVGAPDAAADGIAVTLRESSARERQADALADAASRRLADARRSSGGVLRRAPSLIEQGIVSTAIATLDDPVSQMCTSGQFEEAEFTRLAALIGQEPNTHRKQWEFVYILALLERRGYLAPGRRGLGFGTGIEPLPAVMANRGIDVLATDVPAEDQAAAGWTNTNQHTTNLQSLFHSELVDRATFERHVGFRPVDMNHIPADLTGFDFCWSACAFEHLGSIRAGLAFVENSLATLAPGGIAVHTTELNLVSDTGTIDNLATVLFRWRDFIDLAVRLRGQGHDVLPLCLDSGTGPLDVHIDTPPYAHDIHLKIALAGYVTTSFGIAVVKDGLRRG